MDSYVYFIDGETGAAPLLGKIEKKCLSPETIQTVPGDRHADVIIGIRAKDRPNMRMA